MSKTVPTAMQNDLDGRATHHCFCWQVTRGDAQTFGFTDHDRNLTFDSTTFVAETGLTPSAIESSIGLSVDNMDVMGILNSISIDEQDLAAGLYDNATITSYRVDWQNVANRVIVLKGSIGEVSRGNLGFTAEIRGLAHELNQPTGRIYTPTHNAAIGTAADGINLNGTSPDGHAYRVNATVTTTVNRHNFFTDAAAVNAVPQRWFGRGKLTWTSGANVGLAMEIKVHDRTGTQNSIFLWEPMPFDITLGDGFQLEVGHDGSTKDYLTKFGNLDGFQGFNLIPGNDVVLRSAVQDEDNSGGSLFN